jgi:hypothetical protein
LKKSVILGTQEAGIGRIEARGQVGKKLASPFSTNKSGMVVASVIPATGNA